MPRALLFLLTTSLFGQFYGLSTNNDGSQLYFATPLQLSGTTNENIYGKIFRYDSTGLHFVAQMDKAALPNGSLVSTNAYNLESGYISGNGSVSGYVGYADCGPYIVSGCAQTTILYSGRTTTIPYGCTISGNAQYAACGTGIIEGVSTQYAIYNLFVSSQTPAYIPLCSPEPSGPRGIVTSDGHFLCGTTLWSASGPTTINLQGYVSSYTELLSDDGSHIVTFSDASLFSYDVATGTTSSVPIPNGIQPLTLASLSSDGSVILFNVVQNSISQLEVIHADGTGLQQLTNDLIGVSFGALSGDGSAAFVATTSGDLLKIDTTSGASTVLANGMQISALPGAAVAGAPFIVEGVGFADAKLSATTVPLGTSLGGTQVTVNGIPAPLFSVSPTSISFQIPWETPVGNASIAVVRAAASAFQQPVAQLETQNVQPVIALSSAITEDFSALNSLQNPAKPGDIVNFYLTGLGPVTAPVVDGTPSPSSPLPRVVNPVTVTDLSRSTQLNVLYAGLAPGLIAIYQLTVQLPPVISTYSLFSPLLNSTVALPAVYVVPNQ